MDVYCGETDLNANIVGPSQEQNMDKKLPRFQLTSTISAIRNLKPITNPNQDTHVFNVPSNKHPNDNESILPTLPLNHACATVVKCPEQRTSSPNSNILDDILPVSPVFKRRYPPCSRRDVKKDKIECLSDQTNVDKPSAPTTETTSQATNDPKIKVDDISVFTELVGRQLRSISNPLTQLHLQQKISNLLFDAQITDILIQKTSVSTPIPKAATTFNTSVEFITKICEPSTAKLHQTQIKCNNTDQATFKPQTTSQSKLSLKNTTKSRTNPFSKK